MTNKTYKAYWVEKNEDGSFEGEIVSRNLDDLPSGDILIRVHYSSLNYKDALSVLGKPGVTRNYPHTPGIDAVGIVESTNTDELPKGTEVIVTGYDLGMNTYGGFAEYIRVPKEWVVPLPSGLTMSQSMALGTAGLTAGLSVKKLLDNGVSKGQSVAVTGATGGVGSIAIALLSKLGFKVEAVSGKAEVASWLRELGAESVISRDEFLGDASRPMLKPRWSGIVDTVGGSFIEQGVKQLLPSGSMTCCGMVAGPKFSSSVFPFILRDVNLLGVDSVEIPLDLKALIWQKFASEWHLDSLASIVSEIDLSQLSEEVERISTGNMQGRVLVNLSKV